MTMTIPKATLVAFLLFPPSANAEAVDDKYKVTEAEKTACGADVLSLCGDVGNEEDKVLACMKSKRADLSPGCRTVFDQGMVRRGLR